MHGMGHVLTVNVAVTTNVTAPTSLGDWKRRHLKPIFAGNPRRGNKGRLVNIINQSITHSQLQKKRGGGGGGTQFRDTCHFHCFLRALNF